MQRKRHRWVKLRLHVYMCRECGTARENRQGIGAEWFTVFYLPSGGQVVDHRVPPCEIGIQTPARLRKYAGAISAAV